MTSPALSVLMCTEGTYPFEGGGVSTWCHILCESLPQVDFTLYASLGSPEKGHPTRKKQGVPLWREEKDQAKSWYDNWYLTPKYDLPENARKVIYIPLWGTQEPAEFILRDQTLGPVPFSQVVRERKWATTDAVIEVEFVPLLRRFLEGMQLTSNDILGYGPVIYEMWQYFQAYDWNLTWKSEPVWRAFIKVVLRPYESRPHDFLDSEIPSHFDLTTALRWMYNFLMPLNAPVPQTDLVHLTIASFAGIAGIVAKHHYNTPLLLTEHGVSIRERYIAISAAEFGYFSKQFLLNMYSFISKILYGYADVVSPVANFNRRWEEKFGVSPERIETIYNGIDPAVFVPKPKPSRTAKRPTAVAAARVFPLKDIEMMIQSAAVARDLLPNVYFLVYGSLNADPPYVAKCRKLIQELGLENTFEFGGFHSKPAEIYTEGDISVLSSISEGFPFTVLESMSCARPVVGTDVGGVKEALDGFGVITAPRDPQGFGEGVVKLLKNDELRMELGRKAREEIILKYQTKDMIRQYWELYQRLVDGHSQLPKSQTTDVAAGTVQLPASADLEVSKP